MDYFLFPFLDDYFMIVKYLKRIYSLDPILSAEIVLVE